MRANPAVNIAHFLAPQASNNNDDDHRHKHNKTFNVTACFQPPSCPLLSHYLSFDGNLAAPKHDQTFAGRLNTDAQTTAV